MTDINIETASTVCYLDHMGDDSSIVQAARVSTQGMNLRPDSKESLSGLISYLMRNRHGSPFEHGAIKFYVKAPIFVFREFHRHRIGFSYNEMSGRYREMPANFYSPAEDRPLDQTGKPGHYDITASSPHQADRAREKRHGDAAIFATCWAEYTRQLSLGIPKEMARTVLPLALFSEMYVTCNPRSLMSFLSLRVDHADNAYVTKPLYEIQAVAEIMEAIFADLYPVTYEAWAKAGRVAP